MRLPTLILLQFLGLFSLSQENNLKLTINFPEDINDSVFLSLNKKTYRVFAEGNSVVFNVHTEQASKAWLSMKKTKCLFIFYTDPGEIEITGEIFESDGKPCISRKKLKGGKTEDALADFDRERQKLKKKFVEKAAKEKLKELSLKMIRKYSSSQVSVDVIDRVYRELGKEWTESALDLIDDSISRPVNDYLMKSFRSDELMQKGNYIDFTQNDIEGSPFTLSSLKGKYVLLDFWASWCIPCRQENPKLKSLYEEYNERGLEVVSISLDDNENKWKAAVEKDGLPWIHISDLKGWNNEISSTLGIRSIPATILIDQEGRIVDFNLRGNQLEKAVAKLVSSTD
jgi:thiol-disulfide isomerase/thioredoxin